MLNASLQLRSVITVKNDAALRAKLDTLLQRIFVARLLSQHVVVAIGGTQGAGKTTLVRQLYDIGSNSEWLPANEGQGERVPVLIEESPDVTEPEGWVHQLIPPADMQGVYIVELKQVDAAQFHQATRGANPSYLLPVLKVPVRHFHASSTALLLLPGYEHRHRLNEVWQELMCQALALAGGCVIVTDQKRLADAANQEILRNRELSGVEPVVVITKTEEDDEDLREELRASAAKTFKAAGGQVSTVICTGLDTSLDSGFIKKWSTALIDAIGSAGSNASSVQGLRAKHLTQLLDEVRKLINDVEEELSINRDNEDDIWENFIEAQLKPYDKAAKKLRASYLKQLNSSLAKHRDEAWKHVLQAVKPDEGFEGWFSGLIRSTSERLERQRALIEQAWKAPGDCQECHLQALTHATFEKFSGTGMELLPRPAFSHETPLVERTGYQKMADQSQRVLPPEAERNLSILLTAGDERGLSQSAGMDIALLPALAAEFSRLSQLAAVDLKNLRTQSESISALDAATQAKDHFNKLMGIQNEVVVTIGTVFGVKPDGNFYTLIDDLKTRVPKGQGAGRIDRITGALLLSADIFIAGAGAAVVAGAGIVAVGLLVRAAEKERLGQAEAVLMALEDAHRTAYAASFDETIEKVKDRMIEVQRRKLNLDRGVYERDRLARAVRRLQKAADTLDNFLPPLN
ncbi:hypothetical protein AD951_03325 [Acetobacter malorum]|uniref:Uncharacterized protein n=2 Tax=Acetobacter malorum TaxID=178901 RepID=A0A149UR50_9PROT|nr:hypothetical protein AD951_03325 [Acetobacter malorum]